MSRKISQDTRRRPFANLLPRVISADLRRDALYWIESIGTPLGPRARRWGRLCRERDETDRELLRRAHDSFEGAELVLAVRDPDLVIQRVDFPGLARSDARHIAVRRLRELEEELAEGSNADYAISSGNAPFVGWLIGCADERATETRLPWEDLGRGIRQLVAAPLALAALNQLAEPPEPGELRTIFDLDEDHGSVVVVDDKGWVFSREITPKALAPDEDDQSDADRWERIATEVRRTVHYVETVLRLGTVSELLLLETGDDSQRALDHLAASLGLPVRSIFETLTGSRFADAPPAAALAIGLAKVAEHGGGDLLCHEKRRERDRMWTRRRLGFAATVAAILTAIGGLHNGVRWQAAQARIAVLDEHWDSTERVRDALRGVIEARGRADTVRELLDRLGQPRPNWLGALDSLGMLLPDDSIALQLRVDATEGDYRAEIEVEFRGEDLAAAAASAARFSQELRHAPLWFVHGSEQRDVPPAEARVGSGERIRYRIDAELVPLVAETDAGGGADA